MSPLKPRAVAALIASSSVRASCKWHESKLAAALHRGAFWSLKMWPVMSSIREVVIQVKETLSLKDAMGLASGLSLMNWP